MMLADFIQQAFNNRSISFKVLVTEAEKKPATSFILNSRERFDRIAENTPCKES